MWYKGTLTDKNSKRDNGQPNSIKYRSQDLSNKNKTRTIKQKRFISEQAT